MVRQARRPLNLPGTLRFAQGDTPKMLEKPGLKVLNGPTQHCKTMKVGIRRFSALEKMYGSCKSNPRWLAQNTFTVLVAGFWLKPLQSCKAKWLASIDSRLSWMFCFFSFFRLLIQNKQHPSCMKMGSWVLCSDSILGSIRKNPDLMLHEGNSRFHHDQSSIHLSSLPWCSVLGGGTS